MADDIRDVIVRQGDCVASIAAAHGIGDIRRIMDHPDNRALFETEGRAGGILLPGDVLAIPMRRNEHQAAAGDTLEVLVQMPRTTLRIRLTGADDEALRNHRVLATLPGNPEPRELTTDDDGFVEVPVAPRAREVTLELPNLEQTLIVALGHMDPITEGSGLKKRLANLGFLAPHANATDDELADAVRRFRAARSLSEGTEVDDEVRDALVEVHGS